VGPKDTGLGMQTALMDDGVTTVGITCNQSSAPLISWTGDRHLFSIYEPRGITQSGAGSNCKWKGSGKEVYYFGSFPPAEGL
jgi:hypothetical protein